MPKKKRENMYDTAQKEREQEQAALTAAVTGKEKVAPEAKKSTAWGKITLSMTEEDKLKVKRFALDHGTTVSYLVHTWIGEHC